MVETQTIIDIVPQGSFVAIFTANADGLCKPIVWDWLAFVDFIKVYEITNVKQMRNRKIIRTDEKVYLLEE